MVEIYRGQQDTEDRLENTNFKLNTVLNLEDIRTRRTDWDKLVCFMPPKWVKYI